MWAGGWFSFTRNPELELRIGEDVVEQSSVRDAEFKSGMIFVQQQRDLYRVKDKNAPPELNGQDWAVREIRTHVFRQNEDVSKNDSVKDRAKRKSARITYPYRGSISGMMVLMLTCQANLLLAHTSRLADPTSSTLQPHLFSSDSQL